MWQRLDDAMNPIVVKELRQAVQSKFVVTVLMLFLAVQLVVMGIYLVSNTIEGRLESAAFQAGRDVFMILQCIMLGTCLLFIPAYTGMRLAAERSEVNVDLLFVSTLKPRSIIWGKFVAALVLVILIISACTPFMAFTYFLRGIDLPAIYFIVGLDFLAVMGAVMMTIFLAVVPTNRVMKVLLGLVGLVSLAYIFGLTFAGSYALLEFGLPMFWDSPEFSGVVWSVIVQALGSLGLFYTWSVGLVSPHSANRTLAMRLFVSAFIVVSGVILGILNMGSPTNGYLAIWISSSLSVLSLCLLIAISERDHWGPRVTRTIPRFFLFRVPAFLCYSGALGGILFSVFWFGVVALVVWYWPPFISVAITPSLWSGHPFTADLATRAFETTAMLFLYTYAYGLTATLFRNLFLARNQAAITWVIFLILVALGSAVPYLVGFMLYWREWRFDSHYGWLLTNPAAAMMAASDASFGPREVFLLFVSAWAGIVTVLNLRWFIRQVRGFKPFAGPTTDKEPPPLPV